MHSDCSEQYTCTLLLEDENGQKHEIYNKNHAPRGMHSVVVPDRHTIVGISGKVESSDYLRHFGIITAEITDRD